MSKITNDGLTGSGIGCFIGCCTRVAAVGVKGLKRLGSVCVCGRMASERVVTDWRDVDGRWAQVGADAAAGWGSWAHQLHRSSTIRRHRGHQEDVHQNLPQEGIQTLLPVCLYSLRAVDQFTNYRKHWLIDADWRIHQLTPISFISLLSLQSCIKVFPEN